MTVIPTQDKPVAVRLPPDLREYIKSEAKKSFRSLSSEIAVRVERSRQLDVSQPQGAQA